MRRRPAVQQAFDEARFGSARILNVRDAMPTGREAVRRADAWLRGKQAERAGEVLIITGRGNGSPGRVPVVREEIRSLLTRLRHAGVVARVREHTPGSFAVELAPLRALLDAADRSRRSAPRSPEPSAGTLEGLPPATLARLRVLAVRSLESLGISPRDERVVAGEMAREFSLLVRGADGRSLSDAWLAAVIEHALREFEDGER